MKKILLVILVAILMVGLTTAYSDEDRFNRADSATLGGNWTPDTSAFNISNNAMNTGAAATEYLVLNNKSTTYFRFNYSSTDTNAETIIQLCSNHECAAGTIGPYLIPRYDKIRYHDGAVKDCAFVRDNQVIEIELKNIDYGADTYDLVVNGSVPGTVTCAGLGFFANIAQTNMTALKPGAGQTITIDDIGSGSESQSFNPLPAADTLNISALSIANNTQHNYSGLLDFNITGNFSEVTECNLWINGTINQTNTTGIGAATDLLVNFTVDLNDGHYTAIFGCNDSTTFENTTTNTFYIDTVSPAITWNVPTNNNDYFVVGNLTSNITLTDDNLYSYRYNITWINNTPILNETNTSLLGLSTKTITNVSYLALYPGRLKTKVEVCDGHTKNYIEPFEIVKTKDRITFDETFIHSFAPTKTISQEKLVDRHTFTFEYDLPAVQRQFIVPIDCTHVPNSKYKGHFVCEKEKKWIDFEGDYDVEVLGNVVVVTSSKAITKWEFKSIGELNCNEEETEIFSVNHTYEFEDDVLAGDSTTFYFNMTYNSSWFNQESASLWYNNTEYVMTESLGTDLAQYTRTINAINYSGNMSVIFEYNVNGTLYNTSEQNQSVAVPKIDNCSTYSRRWINFTIRDELNDNNLTGDVEYLFEWSLGTHYGSYNDSMDGRYRFSFCLHPSWANFTSDIFLQYEVPGYSVRDYIQSSYEVDNRSENVTLYALSTGNSTAITIHVIDQSDNDLAGVDIRAYRWDIGDNQDYLVEIETTDSDGNAIFNLRTQSEYYWFEFYQGSTLRLTTTKFKIFSTSLEYVLSDTETTRLEEWLRINGITRTLTYDNATKRITFTWDDGSNIGQQFCLNVTDRNRTYINNCSISQASSVSYVITTFNISYDALGIAQYNDSGNWYVLETLSINTYDLFKDVFGNNASLIVSWIVFTFIVCLALITKNIAVVGGVFAFIILYFFGALPLGISSIIGICLIGFIVLVIMNKRYE